MCHYAILIANVSRLVSQYFPVVCLQERPSQPTKTTFDSNAREETFSKKGLSSDEVFITFHNIHSLGRHINIHSPGGRLTKSF